jgi:hypothetical protein
MNPITRIIVGCLLFAPIVVLYLGQSNDWDWRDMAKDAIILAFLAILALATVGGAYLILTGVVMAVLP